MKEKTPPEQTTRVLLEEFPGIPFEYTEALKSRGILHADHFLKAAAAPEDRKQLAAATGIPEMRLEELHALCRLALIPGVAPSGARALYHAGIRNRSNEGGSES